MLRGRGRHQGIVLGQGNVEFVLPHHLVLHVEGICQDRARDRHRRPRRGVDLLVLDADVHKAVLDIAVRDVLDRHILGVCLPVCADGKIEHVQRADAELVDAFSRRVREEILAGVIQHRVREAGGPELVAVTAEKDDADAELALSTPHGFEDGATFVQEPAPGVGGADVPVLGEGDAGGDDLPADFGGFGAGEVREEGLKLGGSQDGRVDLRGLGAIGARVEHEEGGRAVDKREVRRVLRFGERHRWDGRIHADMVMDIWVSGGWIGCGGVSFRPVIGNLVVIERMNPGEANGVVLGP